MATMAKAMVATVLRREQGLVVVDKPPGVLTVPAPGRGGSTMLDLVGQLVGCRVFAVHRLDEETSGAMIFALDEETKVALEEMFRSHAIERHYLALLASAPSPAAGRIDGPLAVDSSGMVRVVRTGGQKAITHYETIERRGRCCLVRCRLETGRRNQIRAHMAAMGCPLAGDRKYGFRARVGESFPRVMLHSWLLRFRHPATNAEVEVVVAPQELELQP